MPRKMYVEKGGSTLKEQHVGEKECATVLSVPFVTKSVRGRTVRKEEDKRPGTLLR